MDILAHLAQAWMTLRDLTYSAWHADWLSVVAKFFPFVLLFELPVQAVVMIGGLRHHFARRRADAMPQIPYCPKVTCIITCYSEGADVRKTIESLTEQLYVGHIEMLALVDGAHQNRATADVLYSLVPYVNARANRRLEVVPKIQRGGRVSSLNQGLALAKGAIVCALDGDTSFDNDMVFQVAQHFRDANVVAVSGNLRVRNAKKTLVTRLQALEYMLSIHLSRAGLDQYGAVNNISGAFGVFRRDFLRQIGGWDSGTAEDLDLTLRIKKYFSRYPDLGIRFEPRAVGHTDAPESLGQFLKQRLRWDGDLSYLYLRKYRGSLRPGLLGWRNFIALAWTGLFFQLVLPFVVLAYMSYVFFVYPAGYVLGVLAFVYLFYALLGCAMYVEYVALLSERRRYDLSFAWVLLLFPGFAFITRTWNAVSTLAEMFTKSHLDSSMAPWWVLRKTKF
jgi:cellulose synthase/poly-beta-1,6-N-acetylglucosamine synthase-like glycosyltransferase